MNIPVHHLTDRCLQSESDGHFKISHRTVTFAMVYSLAFAVQCREVTPQRSRAAPLMQHPDLMPGLWLSFLLGIPKDVWKIFSTPVIFADLATLHKELKTQRSSVQQNESIPHSRKRFPTLCIDHLRFHIKQWILLSLQRRQNPCSRSRYSRSAAA